MFCAIAIIMAMYSLQTYAIGKNEKNMNRRKYIDDI